MKKSRLNREEKIARDYLTSCGHKNIIYEPDGNIPPDFSIEGAVGVEVRRLNQQHFAGTRPKGIEQEQVRLYQAIAGVLREFDGDRPDTAYWIALRYQRPLGKLKEIKRLTREALEAFLQNRPPTPHEMKITHSLTVSVIRDEENRARRFEIGIDTDLDSGGWIIPMYVENIDYCIREKVEKIRPYREKYTTWWLILVDMLLSIWTVDIPEITRAVKKPESLDRIIVVHPETARRVFEI